MSTEEGEAGSACGEATVSRRHTWDEGEPRGSQGRPRPEDEAEQGEGCAGDDEGGKAQAMHSNCSSETCIPTPSCRICFQGAEQVRGSGIGR